MSDVEARVVVTAAVDGSVRKVGRTLRKLGVGSADLARDQRRLDAAAGQAARSTGRLGSAMESAGGRAGKLALGTRKASRNLTAMHRAAGAAGKALDKVGNKYTALVSGAGTAATVRFVGNLQERFTRLGIQANIGADEVQALKRRIYDVSRRQGIRVDPGQVTAGIEKIVEKTGDLDLARANIENIALVIQAAGAAGQDAGAMVADMAEKFGIKGADQMKAMLDTMVRQGKVGAFTLQNMASQGERVTSAYAALGRQGPEALREMGALLQMARKGTGSAEQAATAFERLLAELVSKSSDIEDLGVTVWDEEALARGEKQARSAVDIVKDIMRGTGGDVEVLGDIFGDESIRALNQIKLEFQKTGGFGGLDSFMGISGDGKQLMDDAARASKTFNQALGSLLTAWQAFADARLTGPIDSLASLMDMMSSDQLDTLMSALTIGAGAVGAAIVGRKVYQAGSALKGLVGGRRGKGGLAAAAARAAGAGGATPVMVTNWPVGGLGGTGGSGAGNGRAGRGRVGQGVGKGLLRGGGRLLGKMAMPLMVGMSLFNAADAASDGDAKGVGGALGGLGGGLAGAAAGAAIGSVVPVIGTAIGGIAGGLLGSLGGENVGSWLGGLIGGGTDEPAGDATTNTTTVNNTVNVTGGPGQTPEDLARAVVRETERQQRRALYD